MKWFNKLFRGGRVNVIAKSRALLMDEIAAAQFRYDCTAIRLNGEEWILIEDRFTTRSEPAFGTKYEPDYASMQIIESMFEDDAFECAKTVLGMKCHKQLEYEQARMVDRAVDEHIPTDKYFGLSDRDDIIIRFNVVEYRQFEATRKFANGLNYAGRRANRTADIVVGVEAKEKYDCTLKMFAKKFCGCLTSFVDDDSPRLHALKGSMENGGGAPGDGVRAYALHLAEDKTTTFAQNVDNFISYIKGSKETCPYVVMRNMRQFMSGMKNYLVKHGEREFEKEVEKEQIKVNEFLDLDAILEDVLHGAVITPLRSHLYGLLADKFTKSGDIAQLTDGMRAARLMTSLQLGIRPTVRVPSNKEMVSISESFVKMQEADSPLNKLENLLSAISLIFNAMKAGIPANGGALFGADDFLPVLVLTLARCSVTSAESEAEVMACLLPPPILAGEGGYYLTALFGAVAVLKQVASTEKEKVQFFDWKTGSLGSALEFGGSSAVGCGMARVFVSDESSGALQLIALPWKPGARVHDLCRALAHRARITNPQDYALFALRDGEEILLNESDCPQNVLGENKHANCMLAYKRMDTKIAWPMQAFSYN